MWSVCRQRTGCVCTSAGRIVSRTDCVDTGTCCASAFSTTIDTSRAGCPIGLRRARCPTAGTNCSLANFTAVKAMLGFQPTNPLVVTFDAINSLSTLRSTKYELRTHSSTDDSLDARMSGMYSLGQNHQ